jgi:hypothetical protein
MTEPMAHKNNPRQLKSMRLSPYAMQLVEHVRRQTGMSEGQVVELCIAAQIDDLERAALRIAVSAAPATQEDLDGFLRTLRAFRSQLSEDAGLRERPDAQGPRRPRKLKGGGGGTVGEVSQ